MIDTINRVGYYCGRFGDGLSGELQNSLSNGAFVIAAGLGYAAWRSSDNRDVFQGVLIVLAALIGVGSFIFHSAPNAITLQIDLIPIQVFGLAAFYYVARREFGLPVWGAICAVLFFFLVRQGWLSVVPPGVLGGGVSHVPTVLLLVGCAIRLTYLKRKSGRYFMIAAAFYTLALIARAADLSICSSFPIGVHWVWHLATAAVVGSILLGIIKSTNVPEASD